MPIEDKVDWDEVSEELLLNIVPINDPEYGGDKPTALRNARRMYMFATNPQKYLEKAPEFIGEKPTDLYHSSEEIPSIRFNGRLVKKLMNNPAGMQSFCDSVRAQYVSKENLDGFIMKHPNSFKE